ncbi:uncharacterized protein LOC113208573 [Frankliniella occidentalis]|uniref:Uncharacterized protein LOC113208573 n=1 Tax=Frankliniella occidentalis TaxID=133901 RepID=A0A9C6U304_FRAOC|nr:uncharacterized protein LOC113208573 [Frankliniella occidentalis]
MLFSQEEMYEVMMRVQNQKVGYLKTAVFELQRQNAVLINEVIRCNSRECVDNSEKRCFELIDSVKHPREVLAPNSGYFQKVLDLEQKITQLEEELNQHRNLVQHQDLQVKSLLKSRQKLTDRFHKELELQKKKAASEVQAALLEEKAKHLLILANQGIERTKQFETSISTFYDKFQDVLLAAQAKNSQSRHDDLQRIIELEQKLISSVTTL